MSQAERAHLEKKPADDWTIAEVGMWLEFISMGEFRIPFIEQQISGQDLLELTEADLVELGVKALGQRKRLQRNIKELKGFRSEEFGGVDEDRFSSEPLDDDRASRGSSEREEATKIRCKCYYRKDIRLLTIKSNITYRKLISAIREEYNRTLQIYWEDEDGDEIKIGSDRQLRNAIQLSRGNLKLKLQRRRDKKRTDSQTSKPVDVDNSMLDSLVDGCVVISSDGYIEIFNKAAERLFGYTRSQMIGQNVKVLMPGMYSARHDSYIQNYHRTGVAKIIGTTRSVLGKHIDGRNIPLELTVTETKTKNQHTFTGMLKQVRESASTVDDFNMSLLNSLLEPVICIDERGVMLHINPKALEFFGYSDSEAKGQNVSMLMPMPHRENHNYYLNNYKVTGKTTVIGKTRDTVCELRDGSIVPIRLSVSENVLHDGSKRFIGTVSVRKTGQQRLVSKLVQQRQVIETLATPAIIISSTGIIQAFNHSALKILGYSLDEVLGQNVSLIVGGGHAQNHDQYLKSYLNTGITKVIGKDRELYARAKSGKETKILLTVTENKDDNNIFFTGMFFHTGK